MVTNRPEAYVEVLEDLKRRKKLLETLVAQLEKMIASGALDSAVGPDAASAFPFPADLAGAGRLAHAAPLAGEGAGERQFRRWTLSSAILYIIEMHSDGCANADIIRLLDEGGFEFRSQNRSVAVAQCLKRLHEKGDVRRLSRGRWALP